MRLIFLGPPGAGKGTQAEKLAFERNWRKISTGDILRTAIKNRTELGKMAEVYMNQGQLVPDDVMLALIREVLSEIHDQGFILDGFPRTVTQAEGLDNLLNEINLRLDRVIYIDVPDEDLVSRLSSRWICRDCGEIYNLPGKSPGTDEKCFECKGTLIQREDDKPETIRKRLRVYQQQTAPLIDYYRKQSLLTRINGLGSIDEIYRTIYKSLR
jgi:adenylate kinase